MSVTPAETTAHAAMVAALMASALVGAAALRQALWPWKVMQSSQLAWELLVWSPLQGVTTAVVGVGVLWFFRGWLSPRRSMA